MRAIGQDVLVNSLADDLSGGRSMGAQVAKVAKATWMKVEETIINGGNTTSHTLTNPGAPMTALASFVYGPWLDSGRFGPGAIKYVNSTKNWYFRGPGDADYGAAVNVPSGVQTVTLRSLNRSKYITVTITAATATADGETMINFASSNAAFDGLNRICAPSMVRSSTGTNGDTFDLSILDALIDAEKVRTNRAFVMSGRGVMKFLAVQRALGGTTPENVRLPGYSGPSLAYRGIVIVTSDYVQASESKGSATTLESVYLASFDGDAGLFWGYPSPGGTQETVAIDPRTNVTVGGIRIESLGPQAGNASRGSRFNMYGALGLRSSLALARAKEINMA